MVLLLRSGPGTGAAGGGSSPALVVLAAVLGPLAWSLATVVRPHAGTVTGRRARRGDRCSRPWARRRRPPASPEALALLRGDAARWTWTAAAVGHRADDLQLAVRAPVMPVGGFAGDDPSPTLAAFQADVAAGRIHWFVAGIPAVGTRRGDQRLGAGARPARPGRDDDALRPVPLSVRDGRLTAGGRLSSLGDRREDDGDRQRARRPAATDRSAIRPAATRSARAASTSATCDRPAR